MENFLEDMAGISCEHVIYEKYEKVTREIMTKLCFSEPEGCFQGLVLEDDFEEEDDLVAIDKDSEEDIKTAFLEKKSRFSKAGRAYKTLLKKIMKS